ncbi:MAG: beta strand repeat-containing protein, partial [Cyanobacteriota bacterium]
TGAINLGPATLADGVTLTAGNGSAATPINLAAVSGTAGGASSNLTFKTSGAVHVSGPVGTDIGTVTITNSGGTTFAGNVQINTLITTANPYAISFTGAANSIAQKVDFLNSGTVSFGDASGTDLFLLDGGLAFTGHAPSAIGGTIRTSSDAINFGSGGVTLLANSIVDTTNNGGSASGASINLGGTITDGVGSFGLDLNAGSAGSIYATVADAAGAITINLLKISNAAPNSAIFAGNVQVDSLVTTANPYSISFTGANNSFTQKVDFLNTGTVSLGDASGSDVFLFDGGLAFSGGAARSLGAILRSSADAIDLGAGATTLIGNTSIDTTNQGGSPTGAAISLASTVSGSAYNLTLNAGSAGTITSSGVDAAGAITLKDLTISNASSASFAGNLTLDSLTTTASPYSLSLSGSNNRFAQLVTTLNTGILALGDNGSDVFLFDNGLNASGNSEARLAATIRSSADPISFSPVPVTLTASSTVDATNQGGSAAGAAITFGGAVNGTAGGTAEGLTVRGGTGNVSFQAPVGKTADLGAISLYTSGETLLNSSVRALSLFTDQPGTAVLNGDITTSGAAGAQINEWTISLPSSLTIDTSLGNGVVALGGSGGTIDSKAGETSNLTIKAGSGNVTLSSVVGSKQRLGDLAVNTSGATLFDAAVTAKSLITDQPGTAVLNGSVDVNGPGGVQINEATLGINNNLVIASAAGPVVLGSAGGTIDSQAGEGNNLTINVTGNHDVTMNASIGSKQRLGDLAVNTAGATLFNAAVTAKSLITDQPGTAALGGNVDVTGKGGVQINELNIGLNNDLVITSASGPVVLGGTGGTIDSAVGKTNALTITAGAGNDVTLNAAIGGGQRLGDIAVNTAGATLFNAAVNAASLITDQPGTAALNGNVNVNGSGGVQIKELRIGIDSNLAISSTAGPVVLGSAGGTIDSQATENNNLTITVGSAKDVTLNAAIGSGSALGDLLVNTAGATRFNSTITAASLFTDQPGTAALGGDITLTGAAGAQINEASVIIQGPVTINTTAGNGQVRFAGAVDSKTGTSTILTVRSGTGPITFAGPVGSTTKLNHLNLYGGDININAKTEAWNVAMQGNNLNFNADIISPGYGTPGVAYGYHDFQGAIRLTRPVTIQGNIGTINGIRVFTGTETIDGFTLSRFYNGDAPRPNLPDPPSLLNYQLGENQSTGSLPAVPSLTVPPVGLRALTAADAKVCLTIDNTRNLEGCPRPQVSQ